MNIIRASGDMAKEFLEQLIEEFELELATSGTIDPHDEYAGHYHGLDADRDAYIEGIQSESYSGIYRELDSFLLSKGLNVKKNSQEYMALARRFMQAKIKALAIMMEICQGKSYNYTVKNPVNLDIAERLLRNEAYDYPPVDISIPISHTNTSEERASTTNMRSAINAIAVRLREKHPSAAKYILADDISKELEKKHGIVVSGKTILRHYSTHF